MLADDYDNELIHSEAVYMMTKNYIEKQIVLCNCAISRAAIEGEREVLISGTKVSAIETIIALLEEKGYTVNKKINGHQNNISLIVMW